MRFSDVFVGMRYSVYSPDMVQRFGPGAAMFIGFIVTKLQDGDPDGEVEATMDQIRAATGLSDESQVTARKRLAGILKVRAKRMEHRTFYSLDLDALDSVMEAHLESVSRHRDSRSRMRHRGQRNHDTEDPGLVNGIKGESLNVRIEEDLVPSSRHVNESSVPKVANGQDLPTSTPVPNGHAQHLPAAQDVPRAKDRPVRERNAAWDALASLEGVGIADRPNRLASGAIGKALKVIRESCPDLGLDEIAQEIERRADNYRRQWPRATLSPMALARHWARFDRVEEPANGHAVLEREGQSRLSAQDELRWEELEHDKGEGPCRR